jgi:uncharacterized SAM-binding protein YcdF (DUF218 family)
MPLGELKPLLTALVLPPAGPLLLAAIGLWCVKRRPGLGKTMVATGLLTLWLLSCNAMAVALSKTLLQPPAPLALTQLSARSVQAIVVLGGGALPEAPEYGQAQPSSHTLARLRYGLWLANRSGLPVAFAGGVGWAGTGSAQATEGEVAARVAQQDFGVTLRWVDDQSRDTAENAVQIAKLLQADGVRRIALVTDAAHMPRATLAFESAGFEVTVAPTRFVLPRSRQLLEWLPTTHGLQASREVLHEWLGQWVAHASTGR